MAMKYRYVLEMLLKVANRTITHLYIIGGGSRNHTLNQMTANAIGLPVLAGASEATALGNGLVQLIALGELGSLAQARQMLSDSIQPTQYEPSDSAQWTEAYQRFIEIIQLTQPK
jgi:rhamnulokinase